MQRFLPALLTLAIAVLFFLAIWLGDPSDEGLGSGTFVSGGLAVLALALLMRPQGVAVYFARGIAVAIIGIVVVLWLMGGAPINPVVWFSSVDSAVAVLLLVAAVLLRRYLPRKDENTARRRVKTAIAAVVAGFAYLMLFYVGTIGGSVLEIVRVSPRMRADSLMKASIARVQSCAVAFAARNGTYPPSLASMGPSPAGDGCLDDEYATGRLDPVTLAYVPAAPDGAGRIDAYHVLAEGNIGFDHGERRMAFGDESGIIRAGDSAATPEALPVIHGGMRAVAAVRACAEFYRFTDSSGAYPRDSKSLFVNDPRPTGEEKLRWLGCFPTDFPRFDTSSRAWNLATYVPVGDATRPTDYVLEIRPRVYGVTGVRSIRATARGPAHATLENRAATEQDPIVPSCMYDLGDGTCAPEPGGVPARIRLIVADSVAAGDTLRIEIVDPRPAAEQRYPYQYHVRCNFQPYSDPMEPPATYSFSTLATCIANGEKTTDGGKIGIRVWVRDHTGSQSAFDRRVPLKGRPR